MGFVESLRSIIYDILHNLDRINVDLIKSNGLNTLRIRHDSGGLLEFRNDGKVYYNGTEIVTSSGGASDHDALNNLNWAAAGHTIDSNVAMGTNIITGLGAHAANGNAVRYEHLAADEHTQYYNSTRHTKAIHDALNIDADALDGKNAIDFLWLDGSLTMAGDFKLNADLILYDTIIRDCGGIYAPDNLNLDIGINNGVGVYNTKLDITDSGTKLYDGLDVNSQSLTNLTNIYSDDSAASYTRFYNVNSGNTLKFEIDKSYNTSHQILDMNDNNIIHCGALSGDLSAELVIESKYHALGLTAESGYDVDVFRTLDLNDNAITNAAIAGTDSVSFIIDQDNAGAGVSSSLRFNRGSTDGDAAIWWDEGDDEFQFESDVGVTVGSILIDECRHGGSVKTSRNPSTGDYEIEVASGDSIVFKAV